MNPGSDFSRPWADKSLPQTTEFELSECAIEYKEKPMFAGLPQRSNASVNSTSAV